MFVLEYAYDLIIQDGSVCVQTERSISLGAAGCLPVIDGIGLTIVRLSCSSAARSTLCVYFPVWVLGRYNASKDELTLPSWLGHH